MYNQYEKKFMNIRELVKNIIEKLVKFYSVYILYSSVLAIILFPMLLISGIFVFFLSSFRTSWYLADPTIFNKDIRGVWLNTWLHYPNLTLKLFYLFENIDKKTLSELQIETKKIIGDLRRFYSAILTKIHCFFTEPQSITIYFEKNLILINPVNIIKWENNKAINISENREEIDLIIDNLRESV